MTSLVKIKKASKYYTYTTSQLMELFSKSGMTIIIKDGPPMRFEAGDKNGVMNVLSSIGRREEFQLVLSSNAVGRELEDSGYTILTHINIHTFKKLSANTIKSTKNIGVLFDQYGVELYDSQRCKMGLPLKKY